MADILIDLHISVNYAGGGDDATCAAGSNFSCAEVLKSSLASVFGIPIAVHGLAFYVVTILVVCLHRIKPNALPALPDLFVIGGLLITVYSVFLLIGSKVVVGKFCIRCMGLYAVNIGLFVTAWFSHPNGGLAGLKRGFKILGAPAFWATVILLAIAIPSFNYRYQSAAQAALQSTIESKRAELADTTKKAVKVVPADSPMRGDKDAPVVIVEWADFTCGHCQQMAYSLKMVMEKAPRKFRYYFKNFPLRDCSSNPAGVNRSCAAAIAFACANQQGLAWEMHDIMFANNQALADEQLYNYAGMVGLDVESFRSCLKNPKSHELVKADLQQGIELGLQATPTWVINGSKHVGPVAPDVLLAMINAAYEQATNASTSPKPSQESPTKPAQ